MDEAGGLGSSGGSNPAAGDAAPSTQASPRLVGEQALAVGDDPPAVPIVRTGTPPPAPGPTSSPRAGLLVQPTELVRAALAGGDLEAARVANEALGKLLGAPPRRAAPPRRDQPAPLAALRPTCWSRSAPPCGWQQRAKTLIPLARSTRRSPACSGRRRRRRARHARASSRSVAGTRPDRKVAARCQGAWHIDGALAWGARLPSPETLRRSGVAPARAQLRAFMHVSGRMRRAETSRYRLDASMRRLPRNPAASEGSGLCGRRP